MSDEAKKSWLPPEVLAWLRVLAIVVSFKYMGVDADTIRAVTGQLAGSADKLSGSAAVAEQASEAVSLTASNLEAIVVAALARQDEERRKRWTLTTDVARLSFVMGRVDTNVNALLQVFEVP